VRIAALLTGCLVALSATSCAYLKGVGGPREFDETVEDTRTAEEKRYQGALRTPLVEEWSWTLADPGVWALSRFEQGKPVVFGDKIAVGNSLEPALMLLDRRTGLPNVEVALVNPIQCSSVVTGENLLVADSGGFVYLIDGQGNILWRYHAGGPIYREPTVDGDQVIIGTATDVVVALDLQTAGWLWTFRPEEMAPRTELSVLGSSRPVVRDGKVYMGLSDGRVICLAADTGFLQWEIELGEGRFVDVDTTPAFTEDGLMVVGGFTGPIVAIDPDTGARVWRFESGTVGDILVQYGRVYFADGDGTLRCLVAEDGTEEWTFKPKLSKDLMNPPVGSGRTLLVTMNRGQLFAIDAFTGDVLWRHEPRKSLLNCALTPTVDGRQVLVLTGDGVLRSLRSPPGFYDTLEDEPARRDSRHLNW